MKRLLVCCALVLPTMALSAGPALAEVKTREKTQVKLDVLGPLSGLFGGKAAREGIVSSTAVKGNRKITLNESTGQIVDLSQEKVYELDVKKKTYTVKTFAEIREEMRKAREEAEKQAREHPPEGTKPEPQGKAEPQKPEKELQFDFDVKETGQKKSIAGYEAREVIMTLTAHEKGKTLEEVGGFVMTSDSWLGPEVPALKELAEFEVRYWKQLLGPVAMETMGMSPEQAAQMMAANPIFKDASERMKKEGDKLKGTPLASTTTFEAAKSKEQMAQADHNPPPTSGGGLGGLLAKKMMKKDSKDGENKTRASLMTANHEFQEISTNVAAADVDIPAGYKEKK